MPFTTEEAWGDRYPDKVSVHLEQFPTIAADWHNGELAQKWVVIKNVRRAVTGALELERAQKRIGSSLEASPTIYVQMDDAALAVLRETDLAEICITSGATLEVGAGPEAAFRLDDLKNVGVVSHAAKGTKCARSWRYTHDVGSDAEYPDVSARDAAALHELKALGKLLG